MDTLIAITLGTVTVTGASTALLAVARRRSRAGRTESALPDPIVSSAAVFTASGIAMLLLLAAVPLIQTGHVPQSLWTAGVMLGGGWAIIRSALSGGVYLYRWCTRRPLELPSRRGFLQRLGVETVGMITVGVVVVGVATRLASHVPRYLLLPVVVSFFPLYDSVFKPWLLFAVGGRMYSPVSEREKAMEEQMGQMAEELGLRGVRLVILRGDTLNAFALGIAPSLRWIVIGGGLLQSMDDEEIRAVIAHELAHLKRHDVATLALIAVLGSLGYALLLPTVYSSFDEGRVLPGLLLAVGAGAILWGLVPGLVSRRLEFGADRTAAELLEQPSDLCRALVTLAELRHHPIEGEQLTHPSVLQRVHALRAADH